MEDQYIALNATNCGSINNMVRVEELIKRMSTEQRIWVIGDLHLGQHSLTTGNHPIARRKPGYERRIFDCWDHSVQKEDIVVVLGNVTTSKERGKRMRPLRYFERIADMPGHKILCMGNQERNRPQWYERFGFGMVVPINEALSAPLPNKGPLPAGMVLFSHLPAFASVLAQEWDERYRGLSYKLNRWFDRTSCMVNIHAHTMNRGTEMWQTIDAGVDAIGDGPVTIEQLIERKYVTRKDSDSQRDS